MSINVKSIEPLKHHDQGTICASRPSYRQGRKDTAVKVYTINQESKYLLIFNVPAVGAQDELRHLCEGFGEITRLDTVYEYPCEEFTEVYVLSYLKIQTAKFVKRKLDGRSFFGGVLHVCYAPEFESVEETRQKLIGRARFVGQSTNTPFCGPWNKSNVVHKPKPPNVVPNPPSSTTVTGLSVPNVDCAAATDTATGTYIWAGKVYSLQQATTGTGAIDTLSQPSEEQMPEPPRITHLLPRQLRPTKRKRVIAVSSSSNKSSGGQMPTNTDDSFGTSSADIRNKMSQLKTPTLATCFKRKRY